ncbi:MAG TPA: CDP-alcohol phosphatidyltransferase family protein [Planctomycetes bacterium]|nr:CDP-alcohol phosphatidyltransferase family protein [Planctomycetota bacterium]HIN79467.1 CDP-alcohol phosphatidyltransferase family protein [Planctomycetota bacterium]
MVSVYDLKPAFQKTLRPLVRLLARTGVSANQVTIAAILLSMAAGLWVFQSQGEPQSLLAIPAVLLLRMALNAIDGMLAREHDMKSSVGALLNELGDVISDIAIYLPLAVVDGFSPILVVGMVLVAVVSEMTGVIAVQIGASRRYDGPMGKSDRALVIGILCGLSGLGYHLAPWQDRVLLVMIFLGGITILNRSVKCLGEVK